MQKHDIEMIRFGPGQMFGELRTVVSKINYNDG